MVKALEFTTNIAHAIFFNWYGELRLGWAFLLITTAVIVLTIGTGMLLANASCLATWSDLYTVDWGFFSGCRALVDGSFVPTDILRDIR